MGKTTGKIVEFPRQWRWQDKTMQIGTLTRSTWRACIEEIDGEYHFVITDNGHPIGMGKCERIEDVHEAIENFTKGAMVIRPLRG